MDRWRLHCPHFFCFSVQKVNRIGFCRMMLQFLSDFYYSLTHCIVHIQLESNEVQLNACMDLLEDTEQVVKDYEAMETQVKEGGCLAWKIVMLYRQRIKCMNGK